MTALGLPFLIALSVAFTVTLACERVARTAGLVSQPRADRWNRRPVPVLGGVGIMLGVLGALTLVGGVPTRFQRLLFAAAAIGLVGLADDLVSLRPQVKLVAQVVLAGLLIQFGFTLRPSASLLLNVILTVLWIVGVTNAFNLLDNMDGLAGTMAVLVAAFRLVFFLWEGDQAGAAVMAAFLGAILAFLVRNFPPAKIFMGDAGSLFVGAFLGGTCLVGDYAYSRGVAAVMAFPVLLLLIPIFDTTFVTVTRLLSGRPVSRGGQDHTSHRLVSLGITERQALVFLGGISTLSGLLALASYRYGFTHTIVLVALLLVGLFLFGIHLSRVRPAPVEAGRPETPIVRFVSDLPYKRQLAMVTLDVVLIVAAYYAAYLLRFEEGFEAERETFLRTVGPLIGLQLLGLALTGTYWGVWRYTSVPDVLRLVRGVGVGLAATVVYFVFTTRFEGLSRAVFVLDGVLLLVLLGGSRVSFRLLGEMLRRPREDHLRVLIYGAGDGGELMLRELRQNPGLRREPVGFLDDDVTKLGQRILGVPVLGDLERAEELVSRHRIGEVIVASGKIPPARVRQLEAWCAARGVPVVRGMLRLE